MAADVQAASAFFARYHVPRSQVWGGSRGGQSGNVHLHVHEQFDLGRIHRAPGEALCGKQRGWYEREPMEGENLCTRCEEIAGRVKTCDEGNVECWNCGAVIAWEGEEPTDCLKCGEIL